MPAELDNLDPEMDQSQDMDAEPDAMAPSGDVIGTHGEADREGAMAKADLFKLANYSHKLYQKLQDDDQLEAWVQAKITKAADYLASVYHYLEYEMKFSEYGHHLDNSDTLSEGQRMKIKELLSEAKDKMKDLKKSQAEKAKDKKVMEGPLSGGERACTECGGSGMVYEEPMPIPGHVKTKAQKYNTMMKATKAAHKRMDANHNGIPDDEEEMDESFDEKSKVGDTKKTRTGELTKTSTGMVHKNTSYKDDGEAEEKSGKGIKSHAKAQSAAEKKEKAPAQKQSPKSAKTWGMKDSEKFDNRDKEKSVDETYGQGVYEASKMRSASPKDMPAKGNKIGKEGNAFGKAVQDAKAHGDKTMTVGGKTMPVKEAQRTMSRAAKGHEKYGKDGMAALAKAGKEGKDLDKIRDKYDKYDESVESAGKKKCPPMSHIKKMCQDGKSVAEICKMHSGCDQKELKQMVADCKKKMDESKKAAVMWNNIKETQMYIAEKAKAVKDLPGNQEKLDVNKDGKLEKSDFAALRAGKKPKETVKESSDFSRLQELTGRLNRAEKPMIAESREVDQIRALTKRLLG